ncbi:sarcosine oxidase, gamma subunit (plasmid) [Azospirillum sp. B510]|uniref:sarcosine oxidase subunit gamma n=1 Tax=Azospirillum sp. (strain B510) TaxID=137722 RepID=UPI0001C4BC44|nr:sarcosine oxidase subunit gamma family protein [Azospirillum sp. B510]BAI74489.1 sarcosine oxidase, gamma subunit [Azospirillum sp. B510]
MSDTLLKPGRHGAAHGTATGPAGVTVAPAAPSALATLVAGRHRADALADALDRRFGVRPPLRPGHATGAGIGFIGVGPGRWLVLGDGADGAAFEAMLREAAAGLGAVSDQSDAFLLFDLSGPQVRRALAKGVAVDLHPGVFRIGDAATTPVGHIGASFWRIDDIGDAPVYRFAVARSYAASFIDWLLASAAEYGVEVMAAGRD